MLDVHPPHNPTHTWPDFLIHIATIVRSPKFLSANGATYTSLRRSPKFLSANGATYTSLGRSPRFPTRRSPFPLCRRPEWSRRRNDQIAFLSAAPPRATPRPPRRTLSTPQTPPLSPNPL